MALIPARRKPPKSGIARAPERSFPQHLAWLRGFDCSIAGKDGHVCSGRIEAAHVRRGTEGGTSLKPTDFHAIPLCSAAHAEQHRLGEVSFERRYGIDMKAIAEGMAKRSPHRWRWEDDR